MSSVTSTSEDLPLLTAQTSSTTVYDILQRISAKTSDLLTQFEEPNKSAEDKSRLVREHLESDCYRLGTSDKIEDALNILDLSFDSSCEWISGLTPPNLKEASESNIIVLEFFTHCCINCIHSIEDVRQVFGDLRRDLQQRNPDSRHCDIKLVSVHSPKFTREKDNESIRSFAKRMKMDHTEIINDPNCTLWNRFGIFCWPTLLIFGPNSRGTGPNLIHVLMGEGHRKSLQLLLSSALSYFDEKLDFESVRPISVNVNLPASIDEIDLGSTSILKYPGKVVSYGGANILAIADSGNNRVIVVSRNGSVKEIIGGVERGLVNGSFDEARFYNPQGLAFQDEGVLFVADTGNHSIRKLDLRSRTVSTLVSSANPIILDEKTVTLKSPWDLSFYGKEVLIVAAAGNHRLFGYFFEEMPLFGRDHEANSFTILAGSGREENRNNTYIMKASFAQPSGIACSQGLNENDKIIYIADSESSTIRYINSGGRVMGLVGGNRDPTDLFAFGDSDGCYLDVKLQHPMGVCCGMGASKIFIADTYNHKIKMIDVESKHATTLIGTGVAGSLEGIFSGYVTPKKRLLSNSHPSKTDYGEKSNYALLDEPSGISIDDQYGLLYIADTNNHMIKVADIRRRTVKEFELKFGDSVPATPPVKATPTDKAFPWDQEYTLSLPINVKTLKIELTIDKIPDSYEGGEWRLKSPQSSQDFVLTGLLERQGVVTTVKATCVDVPLERDLNGTKFYIAVDIFFCGSSSCYRKRLNMLFHVNFTNDEIDGQSSTSSDVVKQFYYEPVSRTSFME